MFAWLFGRKCDMCGKKSSSMRIYYNETSQKLYICEKCVVYAERRAFRKRP